MIHRLAAPIVACVALLLAGGCASYRTETFDIEVVNGTNKDVAIGLAKAASGGPPSPYEPLWATPEDKAWEAPSANEKSNMALLAPGKDASLLGVKGQFDDRTRAVFRGYWGATRISELLARSHGSPDRVDVDLVPGRNVIRLIDQNGRLGAQVEQTPAAGR